MLICRAPSYSAERCSRSHPVPKFFVRNFAVAFAAHVEKNVAIFHLEIVSFSVDNVDRHIECLIKSFVVSALTLVRHIQIPISRRRSRKRVSAEYKTPTWSVATFLTRDSNSGCDC